jgi:hypothetical protein
MGLSKFLKDAEIYPPPQQLSTHALGDVAKNGAAASPLTDPKILTVAVCPSSRPNLPLSLRSAATASSSSPLRSPPVPRHFMGSVASSAPRTSASSAGSSSIRRPGCSAQSSARKGTRPELRRTTDCILRNGDGEPWPWW